MLTRAKQRSLGWSLDTVTLAAWLVVSVGGLIVSILALVAYFA